MHNNLISRSQGHTNFSDVTFRSVSNKGNNTRTHNTETVFVTGQNLAAFLCSEDLSTKHNIMLLITDCRHILNVSQCSARAQNLPSSYYYNYSVLTFPTRGIYGFVVDRTLSIPTNKTTEWSIMKTSRVPAEGKIISVCDLFEI